MNSTVLARHGALAGAILITGCVLLAGCGGTSTTASSEAAPAGVPAQHAVGAGTANGLAGKAPSAASNGASYGADRTAVQTAGLAPAGQSIIYTASLTVRAANVAAAAKQATAIAVAAGGYIADEQASSGTGSQTGQTISLTLKIPVPAYQAALGQLSSPALGTQVSMQQQASDVTQQVADVNSLVTSEQDAIAALQGLLKRAGSVSGLLQVQQQISADESTLNELQAQQRALNHETTYATVTMTLVSPHHHVAAHKATKRGFLAGLAAGWRALRHATAWVLTALGAALPFLLVVIVLAGVGYAGWRRFGKRRAGPTAAS